MRNLFQSERGSVMMEFIIVFPIYLVLFASIMAIGDMLVHSIRLPSAERTAAFDKGIASDQGSGWSRILDTLFHPGEEFSDERKNQDKIEREGELHHVADVRIQGPWSVLAGVTVKDKYRLPVGGSAGQLLFADWFFADVTDGERAGGDFGELIHGRQAVMHSKNVGGDVAYAYYTLKRRRYDEGETSRLTWRSHKRNPVDLMQMSETGNQRRWREDVAREGWHTGISNEDNKARKLANDVGSAKYQRDPRFVKWSN